MFIGFTAALESSDLMQPELLGLESDLYLGDADSIEPLHGTSAYLTAFVYSFQIFGFKNIKILF